MHVRHSLYVRSAAKSGRCPLFPSPGFEVMSMNLFTPNKDSAGHLARAAASSTAISQFCRFLDVVLGKLDRLATSTCSARRLPHAPLTV